MGSDSEIQNPPGGSTKQMVKFGKSLRKDFLFDDNYLNLNHGSFGTYPRVVQSAMRSFQDKAEARPDRFIRYEYPVLLDESRAAMAKFLNVDVSTVAFVPNATTGVNTVLRNLAFAPKEKILYFATIYGACEKTVEYIVETTPAEAVKIQYTYPVEDDWLISEFERVVKAEEKAGNRVKVAIFDTVVSFPGVRMPFERLTQACKDLGVMSLIDGAHGVGHLELDLGKLDCDFFVSNCHKWLYVPRGCAVFYVPVRNQDLMRSTLPTSHGFTPRPKPGLATIRNPLPPSSKSPYVTNFEFVGTIDNAPYLCIPTALRYRENLGGEAAIIAYSQNLAREGAALVAKSLGTVVMENKTGTLGKCCLSMVKLPLVADAMKTSAKTEDVGGLIVSWFSATMVRDYNTFIGIFFYGSAWWVRLSGQAYLELEDFKWAAETLKKVCERAKKGDFLDPVQAKL
ncbi:PLP-dependent transferase [Tothia fuscella]|uniref:PLP-dependent transferase n=1 Tax=Tothia fuscella TaxID=1048955 RepID=A0A9P4U3B8_9PEZI|nr:PLP-dependent transferase [Tothia fuscella]